MGHDGRGVGFYFRNRHRDTIIRYSRGKGICTLNPGRTQVNIIATRKREHSRKPDEQYKIIEACSPGPFVELFARAKRDGWDQWGNELESYPTTLLDRIKNGKTYKMNGQHKPSTGLLHGSVDVFSQVSKFHKNTIA